MLKIQFSDLHDCKYNLIQDYVCAECLVNHKQYARDLQAYEQIVHQLEVVRKRLSKWKLFYVKFCYSTVLFFVFLIFIFSASTPRENAMVKYKYPLGMTPTF